MPRPQPFNSESDPVSDRKALEPGTDDEPLSSSEDELVADPEPPTPEVRTRVKQETQSSPASVRSGGSSQSQNRSTRKRTFDRTSSIPSGNYYDEGDEVFSSYRSSQNKRFKAKTYPTTSFTRAPSSSAVSAAKTPNRTRISPELSSNMEKDKDKSSEDSESEVESKMTMEIDRPGSDDCPSHAPKESSPGFIVPPLYHDASKSSFETVSSREKQTNALDVSPDLSSSSPLSSAPSEFTDLLEEDDDDDDYAKPSTSRKWLCPMCKEEVDPELLLLFEAQPKQRVREQQQFCASHKQSTAGKEWQKHGYPEIDWETFDQRIKKYFPELEKILAPGSPSYYHNILSDIMKDGKAKNFRLTMMGDGIETISCGYYGTKGAGKMLQAIVDRFSASLRRLSASDDIIKTAGVAGYAQSVLVPELAVCLVKEDMGVDDESARQILRDSIDIGEKVNPAMDDEVPIPVEVEV
ncbi:hypothetical protein N7450_008075 [Penicillium hetheringtonii]|uniref:Restriction of telomere capping protein 4 n=1 Tax=Penicillium hetheringtonii TaxID=911720 RepID=A0AAD6DFG7_9EURO|nr:hypothetical protein N7450_008075 [Penicillium hetheringtonii]